MIHCITGRRESASLDPQVKIKPDEGVIFDGGRVVRMIETDAGQVIARVARSLSD
jgi:hypothetical protein